MRLALLPVFLGSVGLAAGHAWAASPPTCDSTTLERTRASVADTCNCATATSHKDYVKCVRDAIKGSVKAKTLTKDCARAVHVCVAKSTCGTSDVTCCETSAKGTTRCSIKKDSTACKPRHGGSACVGTHTSCCDACGTSGCLP